MKAGNINTKFKMQDKFKIQHVSPDRNMIYSGKLDLFGQGIIERGNNEPQPLAVSVVGVNNTAAPLPNNLDFYHTWTDIDSQEAYLNSKPTCFVILSKPGTGSYSLGESMSKKLNLVHISPKNVIVDEIEQNSLTGRCIDFNLRHNHICKFDTIIAIMKRKIQSPAVQHRGYVISGLPLVTSSKRMHYFSRQLHDEESVSITEGIFNDLIANVHKKKKIGKKVKSNTLNSSMSSELTLEAESEIEEEEDQENEHEAEEAMEKIVALPKFILEPSSGLILSKKNYLNSKQAMLLHQCQELFDFEVKPDIIIFITCPDTDAITKKSRKCFNYLTSSNPMGSYPFPTKIESEIRWPSKYVVLENISNMIDGSLLNRKYNCRLPINFTSNSTDQMCNYKYYIMPYLEKKIREFKSKFVLKLDGRNPTHEMVNILLDKLSLLPVKPILIPEPLYFEEPFDDIEDFWKLAEKMNVIKFGVKRFGRYASLWYNRCPVELKKRHVVQGFSKFAVAFFNHIYILSSLDAMVAFCRNPRPFLKLQYLEPTCRIIVMGTKSSGKSMISQCLSWLFNAPVICYEKFVNDERQKKYDAFSNLILSEIIKRVERDRKTEWEKKEQNRIFNLNLWNATTSTTLQRYIVLSRKYETEKNNEEVDDSSTVKIINLLNKIKDIRCELSYLPMLDEVKNCEEILKNRGLSQYAPVEFTNETPKPRAPVLGDQDVTQAISAYILENNLQNDVEPKSSEIMHELTKVLENIDSQTTCESICDHEYGKYIIDGFPLDTENWDFLFGSTLLPDYIITIIESREIDEEIAQNYINMDACSKNHEARFRLANDELIKIKLRSKNLSEIQPFSIVTVVKDLINGIVQSIFITKNELIKYLNESMNKFREDWDTLKLNIKETFKTCIEVQIEDKTDIEIMEEVLVNIRKSYCPTGNTDVDEVFEDNDTEESASNDALVYNDPRFLCETNIYCPIAYYEYGVLWEGKPEFCFKYDNRTHFFCNEEHLGRFQNDVTKYQSYNHPFKKVPPLKICVMGSTGSGKTTASKLMAKEYGLIHVDLAEFINYYLLPRHYKRVGRRYENSFTDSHMDEEVVTELNMNEDNINELEIISNENELRRIVYNYLEKGVPLLSVLMKKILNKLWFQPPFSTTGFVLDGFPKMQNDVEVMIELFCIPDLIIELECNSEISSQRLTPIMFNLWKIQLNEAKIKSRQKLDNDKLQWQSFITKHVVVKLIIVEILDSIITDSPERVKSLQSAIMEPDPSGLLNVDANLFNIYNNLILEYPEPIDQNEWEKSDEVREKISYRIEGAYELEDENIQNLKDTLIEQNIKLISVDGTRTFMKVGRVLLSHVANLRHRRETCFEQTFVVDLDVAEMLLLEGFFFLSKFNRMCPVYICDNPDAIFNPYNIGKSDNKITPVIHRSHIYFTCSAINLKKFREHPLKYIVNANIEFFVEYPIRIAVLGPPKSGKSELTAKLAKKYGLLCISKGIALRYIVNNLSWTDLALKITSKLGKGEDICNDTVIQAVQTIINNHCGQSRGYILDGLPSSPFEAMELQKAGLFPLNIFELRVDKAVSLKNSQKEIYSNIIKRNPPYSLNLITYRLSKYKKNSDRVREFINNDTQNLFILNGSKSLFKCFYEADNKISEIIPQIHYYLTNYKSEVVPMAAMSISNDDFQLKMSKFKNVCPLCLRKNIIKHSGYPVNKQGIVQFKEFLYWVCSDHLDLVIKDPRKFLADNVDIPEIPAVVKTINRFNLYEDGICIVTYAENLPAQCIEKGKENYAAVYKEKTYLFCSSTCLKKFMATPQMYYNITILKESKVFPRIFLEKLPHLGYLEQTVGNIITEACCSVNVVRPKYPGLSAQISGLLYIALYLKINNPQANDSYLPLYAKAFKAFDARCQLMTSVSQRLRSGNNPFGKYPICCTIQDVANQTDSGTVRKPSSFKIGTSLSLDCLCENGF